MTDERFFPRPDEELWKLDDVVLLAYCRAARDAGDREAGERGIMLMLYRHEKRIERRITGAVHPDLHHHLPSIVPWVQKRIWNSALKLPMKGWSPGEFVRWWQTVVDRQVVSFFRSAEGKAILREQALPAEHQGDDETNRPDDIGEELDVDRLVANMAYGECIQAVFDSMANETHVAIVRAAYFEDLSSQEVAQRYGTTAPNVDTIKNRFRHDLRDELERRGLNGP